MSHLSIDLLQKKSLNAVNPLCLDAIVKEKTNEFGGDEQSHVMIVVDSLTVSWSNDNPVLENISFTVDKVRNTVLPFHLLIIFIRHVPC